MVEYVTDQAETPPRLQIVDGEDAKRLLTDDVIARLAASLQGGLTNVPPMQVLLTQTPDHIRALLTGLKIAPEPIVSTEGVVASDLLQGALERERQEHVGRLANNMLSLRDKGCMLVGMVGNEIAGCAAVVRQGRPLPGDSDPPLEIKRVTVLPEFRGNRFGAELMTASLKKIDAGNTATTFTRDKAVIRWSTDNGFAQVPLLDILRTDSSLSMGEEAWQQYAQRGEELGWRGYSRKII